MRPSTALLNLALVALGPGAAMGLALRPGLQARMSPTELNLITPGRAMKWDMERLAAVEQEIHDEATRPAIKSLWNKWALAVGEAKKTLLVGGSDGKSTAPGLEDVLDYVQISWLNQPDPDDEFHQENGKHLREHFMRECREFRDIDTFERLGQMGLLEPPEDLMINGQRYGGT